MPFGIRMQQEEKTVENRTILTDVAVRRAYRSDVRVHEKEQGYTLTRAQRVYNHIKRVLDIFLALIAVIILSPVLTICAIAIKCDSKGPAIFKQNRIGRGGKAFRVYKFRTMRTDAPSNVATSEMKDANSYITKVGTFLRKTSLDELPQFFNVLKGDMSLIGPRPLVETETEIHEKRKQCGIYSLRPGVTGLAQVSGRDLVSIDEKVQYDREYLETFSLFTDIKIIFRTVGVVLFHKYYAEGSDLHNKQHPKK